MGCLTGSAVLAVAALHACKGSLAKSTVKSDSQSETPSSDQSGDQSPNPPSSQKVPANTDETAGEPSLVTGTYLADYDNARIRCDYKPANPNSYNSLCRVVVLQNDGSEMAATQLKDGVMLSWADPVVIRGELDNQGCESAAQNLSFKCQLSLPDYSQLAEVGFTLKIHDASRPERKEGAAIVLPYAVGVTAGLVPAVPYTYSGLRSMSEKLALAGPPASQGETLGFQAFSLKADEAVFSYPMAVCYRNNSLYFIQGSVIYVATNGQIALYAGSSNQANVEDTSHRLRIYMEPWYMVCAPDAIYVTSSSLGRVYRLQDDGSVAIIAGKTFAFDSAQDGALAAGSPLMQPSGIGILSTGEIVFAETAALKIRKIAADGRLQTIAGTGASGIGGDGGPALRASFINPAALVVDKADNIYVADSLAHDVRKIAKDGTISTSAGTGTARYDLGGNNAKALSEPISLAVAPDQSVYVGEYFRGVKRIDTAGALTTMVSAGSDINQSLIDAAPSQRMALVNGRSAFAALAFDSNGNLYYDGPDGIIQRNAAGATVSLIGKSFVPCSGAIEAKRASLPEASSIAYDGAGKLWIAHFASTSATGLIFSSIDSKSPSVVNRGVYGCQEDPLLVGDKDSPVATILEGFDKNRIGGSVALADGSVYVAIPFLQRIVKIGADGKTATIAGNGTPTLGPDKVSAAKAGINNPFGLAMDQAGALYFAEATRIRRVDAGGMMTTVAGGGVAGDDGEGGAARNAKISPKGVAMDQSGRIFFTEYANGKVKMVDKAGIVRTIAGGGVDPGETDGMIATDVKLSYPESIAVTASGIVYFVELGTNLVRELKQRADGSWVTARFFGTGQGADCGVGKLAGTAAGVAIDGAIRNSLSVLCAGSIRAVAVEDRCAASSGDIRIAISQSFVYYSNIIEVTKPCQP